MSLINKMLQDLDARGGAGEDAVHQQDVKAVPPAERDRRPLLIGGVAVGVLVLAAGGWYGWQYWKSHRVPPGPVPNIMQSRAPGARPPAAAPPAAAATVANAVTQAASVAPMPSAPPAAPAPVVVTEHAPTTTVSPAPATERVPVAARAEVADTSRARKPASATHAAPGEGVVMRDLTPKQMSENSYRRALAALQEGRINAALADLDKAVDIDPHNDAARQTYISLLLEGRRTDDAMRQLSTALSVDARQPGLAMVLARLQLEKGGPALETLQKTLPYAGNNADYLGFLAGVLQREQRHAEAAEQYRAALALVPDKAVWWMGLGISLQAEQHLPEAREAYRHARTGAGLTPELKSFIDRKLDQLSR
ncbi:tetratricopeptide repeat protein [Duganella lactea]|nr:tetratricopeptide repeat protein [Duganella lactea]